MPLKITIFKAIGVGWIDGLKYLNKIQIIPHLFEINQYINKTNQYTMFI